MTGLDGTKRDIRAVSYALCSAVFGVIVMRLVVWFAPIGSGGYGSQLGSSALFSLCTQLVFFLGVPFIIYRYYGRRSFKGVLEYSSFKGFKPYHLIALPLGVCVFFITIGVSSVWSALLDLTGYNYVPSSTPMPEQFNFGFFAAEILMTAVLPAVCEEFVMRGGFLTTARRTFGTVGCVVLCGAAFGLFHQNVRQVFYTACFGAFAAFLTLRLKSIFPAVLVHFANNFMSVYIDYAVEYDWAVGGGLYDFLGRTSGARIWLVALSALTVCALAVGLVVVMQYLKERRVIENKKSVIGESAFDVTNKRVVLTGELDPERIAALEMEKEVYGADYAEEKYKPSARDVMIVVALGVTTVLTTVFTYVWGFFY